MKTETDITLSHSLKHNPIAPQHQANGLMLFSSTGQLIFMNRDARLVIRRLNPITTTKSGSHLIPEDIHALVRELISQLIRCEHPKDCETIQIERLCFAADRRLLLRGLCVPDAPLARNSHLLVVIEQIDRKSETPDANIQQHFHFTEREQMVIIYLMLGFTNKEIANRLNLSEYTVKEHLKRIMHKTKSTTRTGLLARMIFPNIQDGASLNSSPADPHHPAYRPTPGSDSERDARRCP